MKVVLCGYNWTGCKALQELVAAGHDVAVYTHESPWYVPDLRAYSTELGVPWTCDDVSKSRLPFKPDVICSVYYRNLIKRPVIERCDGRIFNLHPSLLPLYRGCSSLTWAMIDGRTETGFTYHYIDEGCDTGDVLLQRAVRIEPFDTQETLYQRVMFEAMVPFLEVVTMVANGSPGTQQAGPTSYHRRGCPYEGKIDPSWSPEFTRRFIRAMISPPLRPATLDGKPIYRPEDLVG